MTSDPDIYRAAIVLIDQHGADAGLRAAPSAPITMSANRGPRLAMRGGR